MSTFLYLKAILLNKDLPIPHHAISFHYYPHSYDVAAPNQNKILELFCATKIK